MIPVDYIAPEDRPKEDNVDLGFSEAMRLIGFGRSIRLPHWAHGRKVFKSQIGESITLKVSGTYDEWKPYAPDLMRDDWMEV